MTTPNRDAATIAQAAAADPLGRFGYLLVLARHTRHRVDALVNLRPVAELHHVMVAGRVAVVCAPCVVLLTGMWLMVREVRQW